MCYHNRSDAKADMRIHLFPIKPDIKEILTNLVLNILKK